MIEISPCELLTTGGSRMAHHLYKLIRLQLDQEPLPTSNLDKVEKQIMRKFFWSDVLKSCRVLYVGREVPFGGIYSECVSSE